MLDGNKMSSSSEENEKHTRHMCFEPDMLKILGQLKIRRSEDVSVVAMVRLVNDLHCSVTRT